MAAYRVSVIGSLIVAAAALAPLIPRGLPRSAPRVEGLRPTVSASRGELVRALLPFDEILWKGFGRYSKPYLRHQMCEDLVAQHLRRGDPIAKAKALLGNPDFAFNYSQRVDDSKIYIDADKGVEGSGKTVLSYRLFGAEGDYLAHPDTPELVLEFEEGRLVSATFPPLNVYLTPTDWDCLRTKSAESVGYSDLLLTP